MRDWKLKILRILTVFMIAFAIQGCKEETNPKTEVNADIYVSGSSTVYPLTKEAAKRFERENKNVSLAVEFTGTTAGFRKFCEGETQINNASRLINESERESCASNSVNFIEVPIAMDAISIVVHPSNTQLLHTCLAFKKTRR